VTIFDVVSDDGDPWLVREHLPGRSIEELLAGPRVQEAHLGKGVGG
jgi:hypothetical protein